MKQDARASIDRRLARIEGQVRGLRKLLAEDAYCCDILSQVSAVSAALNQVSASIATEHIRHCIADRTGPHAHAHARSMTEEELFEELEDVLRRLAKS